MKLTSGSAAGAVVAGMMNNEGFGKFLQNAGSLAEVAVGEYTGTQAALDVLLPFDPMFVFVSNKTDGDTVGFAINTPNAGTTNGTIVLATAQEAAQGIGFGTAGQKKFTLGNSVVTNETAKVYQYFAIGY